MEYRRLSHSPSGNAAVADLFDRVDQPDSRHARGDLWRQGSRARCGRPGHGDARRQFNGPHLRLRSARIPHRVHLEKQQDHRGDRRELQFLLMKLTVTHTLTCSLTSPARAVEHLLLTPVSTPQQRVERWSIELPGFADAATFRDGFGNRAHLVSQAKPGETLLVTVSGTVETSDKAGVIGKLEYDPPAALFRRATELTTPDHDLMAGLPTAGGRIARLHALMDRVHQSSAAQQKQSEAGQ